MMVCSYVLIISTNSAHAQSQTKGSINGHDWVDLGLSVKWATCNVGANAPEEFGDYYAFGEITPKKIYTEDNCLLWSHNEQSVRCTDKDVAYVMWGEPWCTPNKDHVLELVEKCEWRWGNLNGVNGCYVTGPNGNSIFLPACGSRYNSELHRVGEIGHYWTSTTFFYNYNEHAAYELEFEENDHDRYLIPKDVGLVVRPISFE